LTYDWINIRIFHRRQILTHPFANRTVENAEILIIERVRNEILIDFSFDILRMRLGEVCPYETLEAALNNLVKKGRVVKSTKSWYGEQRYNLN